VRERHQVSLGRLPFDASMLVHAAEQWGAQFVHGRHALGRCYPFGHFHEHVAGDDGAKVVRRFGLVTGRI